MKERNTDLSSVEWSTPRLDVRRPAAEQKVLPSDRAATRNTDRLQKSKVEMVFVVRRAFVLPRASAAVGRVR